MEITKAEFLGLFVYMSREILRMWLGTSDNEITFYDLKIYIPQEESERQRNFHEAHIPYNEWSPNSTYPEGSSC